jgi:hypothetical protein
MLHRFRKPLVILGALIIVAVVALFASWLSAAYFNRQYADAHNGCQSGRPSHIVTVQGNSVLPAHTNAAKCDTMTITNLDDTGRLMAFGHHDDHIPYDGIKERYLVKGQSVNVTLDQTGEFLFHDHLHDEVQGTFTVQ